jgi:hypothetical protein
MAYGKTLKKSIGLSGGESIQIYDVDPDAATGNITIADATEVSVLGVVPLIEDSAATAQVAVQAKENSSTKNQVDFKLWQAVNTAAAAFKDFRVALKITR